MHKNKCRYFEHFEEHYEAEMPGYQKYLPPLDICHLSGNPKICKGDFDKCPINKKGEKPC